MAGLKITCRLEFFRKRFFSFAILVLLLAAGLSGCAHVGKAHEQVACKENPQDPFEPDAVMPGGEFKGKCVNTGNRRSIKILTEQEAGAYNLDPGRVHIANFSHAGTFWVAGIPRDLNIIGVDFVRSWFFFGVAHLSIHFRLHESTPVVLVPQLLSHHAEPEKTTDVVFSLEALESRADPLPFISAAAFFGNYVAVHRFLTLDELREEKVEGLDHLWVDLPQGSRAPFFWKLVEVSDRNGLNTMFRVFAHNCGNIPINALDSVMEYDADTRSRITGKNCFNPSEIKAYLKARGLAYSVKSEE
ncbi:MAG: hypothetical protein AB9866_11510 [Syntrophobacteraceae bacterium]